MWNYLARIKIKSGSPWDSLSSKKRKKLISDLRKLILYLRKLIFHPKKLNLKTIIFKECGQLRSFLAILLDQHLADFGLSISVFGLWRFSVFDAFRFSVSDAFLLRRQHVCPHHRHDRAHLQPQQELRSEVWRAEVKYFF